MAKNEWCEKYYFPVLYFVVLYVLTGGVASCTSQSVYTFCVKCQDPFLPILIVYMENDPMFTARERGFELRFVSKMRNQILYDIKQNIQVKSERIP